MNGEKALISLDVYMTEIVLYSVHASKCNNNFLLYSQNDRHTIVDKINS